MISISKKGQTFILGSSIFLNIALLALIFLSPPFQPPKGPPPPHRVMEQMAKNLNSADREIFDGIFVKYTDRLEQNRRQMHAAVDAMATIMRAESVDASAVQVAHDQLSMIRNDMDGILAKFMVDLSQNLSADARRNLRLFPHPPPKPR